MTNQVSIVGEFTPRSDAVACRGAGSVCLVWTHQGMLSFLGKILSRTFKITVEYQRMGGRLP